MNKNAQHVIPQVKRLILHFNIDKTIVMKNNLTHKNIEFFLKEILCEMIWGNEEMKGEEKIFKLNYLELEPDGNNITDPLLIRYSDFLNQKFKPKTSDEIPDEEQLDQENKELKTKRLKTIWDVTEQGNPGIKFKKQFEDMKKKLRVDEKIHGDLGIKVEAKKFEEIFIKDEDFKFFDEDDKNKYKYIFQNGFHQIIVSFFFTLMTLKKNKREFSIIFRFFGHDVQDIEEFIFEFNQFCECLHPRYNGNHGYQAAHFEGIKSKDYRINRDKGDNIGVHIRNLDPNKESYVFDTIERPDKTDLDDLRDNIEEFYHDGEGVNKVNIVKGFNSIYLGLMEKLAQNCSFLLVDDYPFFESTGFHGGRAFLVDPYDHDTLQIFFDTDLEKMPDKLQVIDIANGSRLDIKDCINKFVVNVDPRKAIIEQNYFLNKIELCEKRRLEEIDNMGVYEVPHQPIAYDFNLEQEIKKLSSDKYLEMAIFPLLHSALTITDVLRPQDPMAFIANFMLKNKNSMKKLEEMIEIHPSEVVEENMNMEENEEIEMEKAEENK